MADDTNASIIPLHHVPLKKREKKAAARKTANPRKKKIRVAVAEETEFPASSSLLPSEFLIPPEFLPANDVNAESPIPSSQSTSHRNDTASSRLPTPSRPHLASILLSIAALALAAV